MAQRTREIGLRMALGATPGLVRRMVLGQVGRMTLFGGLVGMVCAVLPGCFAESLVFEIRGSDPLVIVGSVAALGMVAFGAGFIPAHRASQVDPMKALRYE